MANKQVTNPITGKTFYATPENYTKYINDGYLDGKVDVTPSKAVQITNPNTGSTFHAREDEIGTKYQGYTVNGSNNSAPTQQQIIPQQQVAPQQPQFDIQAEIEKLRKAQTDAAVASLGKARDSSLSNLGREKAQIAPTYNSKRNAASTQSQLNAKSFAEYMAGRGGTNSGVAAQAEMNRQGNLQGQIGSLGREEANAFVENDRRVSDVNNAYNSDVAAAESGAYATSLQNMINQMNTDRQMAAQLDQFNKTFGLQQAGVTGYYNNAPTMANQQYQTGVDQWNKTYQTDSDRYNQEYQDRLKQQEFENWLAQQQLALSQQKATSGSSGGGTATERKQNSYGDALEKAQEWVRQGYTPQQIRDTIYLNAAEYARAGVDPAKLYEDAFKIYSYYRSSSGGRFTQ